MIQVLHSWVPVSNGRAACAASPTRIGTQKFMTNGGRRQRKVLLVRDSNSIELDGDGWRGLNVLSFISGEDVAPQAAFIVGLLAELITSLTNSMSNTLILIPLSRPRALTMTRGNGQ